MSDGLRVRQALQALELAFEARPPEPPLVDCPCPECAQLEAQLADRPWTDLADSEVDALESSLPLLAPHAFRAYLPAFLRGGWLRPSEFGEFLVYSLLPDEFNTPRLDGLSDAQGRAVLELLRHLVDDCERRGDDIYVEDPRRAIDEYWKRYADGG